MCVLQRASACCSALQCNVGSMCMYCSVLWDLFVGAAVCCSMLQCVAVCFRATWDLFVCAAVCCVINLCVLQCVVGSISVCCSVFQCVAQLLSRRI